MKERNLIHSMDLVGGRLSLSLRGFGFVIPDKKESEEDTDIFIPARAIGYAMHNDRVAVRLHPPREEGHSREGEIVRILERANTKLVGTFEKSRSFGFVTPDDIRLGKEVFIPKKCSRKAKTGSKVVVEITRWPSEGMGIEGRVVEVLGKKGTPGVDILSIMRSYDLSEEFPRDVLEAAENVEQLPLKEDYQGRRDRRELSIVTIDGEDAKDLDDGVYAEKRPDGGYFLGVYIADVSWYVRENMPIDREAMERGTSVYLVDRVIPMLPKELSNGICSLNAGVDRLAMACEMQLDREGRVTGYEIIPAVIHVHRRLTYNLVNKVLVEKQEPFREDHRDILPMLECLEEIRNLRRGIREKRGSIDFDIPEIKVRLDGEGHPTALVKREGSLAESIIEECMLAANETVAEHMERKRLPGVYRVHEQPAKDKIEQLNRLLAAFAERIPIDANGNVRPAGIQNVLSKLKGRPEERMISTVSLRSMQQARYAAENLGHFGLAADYYTHFTSPIRRYPDLIVHRLLRESFNTGGFSKERKEKLRSRLPEIAEHSSKRERIAMEVERETQRLKEVEYMAQFQGESFQGTISGVTAFGIFVELDNGVEGLVHVSSMAKDYYNYVETRYALIGHSSNRVYRLGDEVEVILLRANVEEKTLDFVLKDNNTLKSEGGEKRDGKEKRRGEDSLRKQEGTSRLLHSRDLRGRHRAKGHRSKVTSGRSGESEGFLRRNKKRRGIRKKHAH